MERQIAEDLEFFQARGIDVNRTIKEVHDVPSGRLACFVRFQIDNNYISVSNFSQGPDDVRITHVKEVLEDIGTIVPLPDVDFLISLWDSYDNPLYLEHTYCPVFTICKLRTNRRAVLFPEFRNFSYRQRCITDINWTIERSPWENKISIAFWRGMTSGWNYTSDRWDTRPRSRLVLFSKERPDLVDAAFTSPYSLDSSIKTWMERYDLFQPWTYPIEFLKNKFLISIDGNTFASNYWWQLLSNCAVLKTESDFLEWFYGGLSPYVHYIPIELDSSDLEEKVLWCRSHDDEAKKIGECGAHFASEYLTNEALMVYFYKLLQAYSRLN